MGHIYQDISRSCGACRYWWGERKRNHLGQCEVKDTRVIGMCSKPGSCHKGTEKMAFNNCPGWTKI